MVKKKLIKKEKLFEKKILKEKLCGLQLTYPFIDLQDPNLYLKRQLSVFMSMYFSIFSLSEEGIIVMYWYKLQSACIGTDF